MNSADNASAMKVFHSNSTSMEGLGHVAKRVKELFRKDEQQLQQAM